MELFCKTLRTQKFWTGKFFGASTHGILTHSGFRKCVFFLTAHFSCYFFGKQGQLRPPVTQPKTPSTPLCYTYSEPPGHVDSPGGIQNIPYLYKNLSKSRLSDRFFFQRILVFSEVGGRINITKSAILTFSVFLLIFLHEITSSVIDIDNIGCLGPFLPLQDHFEIRRFFGLTCKLDLTTFFYFVQN